MNLSPLKTGLMMRCPRCGEGKLFAGVLQVVDHCPACALDLHAQDSADGPTFFAIVLVGMIIAGSAVYVEIAYAPPAFVHMMIWPPAILLLSLCFLRVSKGLLIAFQYKYRVKGLGDDANEIS